MNTEDAALYDGDGVADGAGVSGGPFLAENIDFRHVSPMCLKNISVFIEVGHKSELLTFVFVSEKFQALDKGNKNQTNKQKKQI